MLAIATHLLYQQVQANIEQSETIKLLIQKLESEQAKVEQYSEAYDNLQQQITQLRRQLFGSKSERYIDNQLELFDDLEQSNIPQEKNEIEVPAHKRKKGAKKELPIRIEVISVADEEQRTCACGKEKRLIGYEVKRLLNYVPAVFEIVEQRREKLGCHCEQSSVTVAPAPLHILPKVHASESLLAHLVSSKLRDRQPFYHLEKQLRSQHGVELSRQTMSHWFIKLTKPLQPIYNLLKDELLDYEIASCDATTLQVLKEPGRKAQTKSQLHCMLGGTPGKEVILFAYSPSDHSDFLVQWFEGYQGKLHADASPVFDQLEASGVILVCCNTHARRKFEAITKASKKNGLAAEAMRIYKKLYRVEAKAKANNMTPEQRLALRQKESKPIMEAYYQWLEDHYPKVLPKSPLGAAMYYVIRHWKKMTRFLDDGRLEADNNHSERAIKIVVLARKNFMFCDTMAGADAIAMHASLAQTAERHGHNVYRYFTYLYKKLPLCKTVEEIEALLPWNLSPEDT